MKTVSKWLSIVIGDFEYLDPFHETLLGILDRIGSSVRIFYDFNEAMEDLESLKERCHLLVADSSVPSFDGEALRRTLAQVDGVIRPDLVLVADPGKHNLVELEDTYCALAAVAKDFSEEQLAFVFNRLFFPVTLCKREHPRALASVEVEWTDFQKLENRRERTFNVSQGGLFVETLAPEAEGQFLELSLYLEGHADPIQCSGRVVYVRDPDQAKEAHSPPGMALRIKGIDERDRLRLSLFVEDRLVRADRLKLGVRDAGFESDGMDSASSH